MANNLVGTGLRTCSICEKSMARLPRGPPSHNDQVPKEVRPDITHAEDWGGRGV